MPSPPPDRRARLAGWVGAALTITWAIQCILIATRAVRLIPGVRTIGSVLPLLLLAAPAWVLAWPVAAAGLRLHTWANGARRRLHKVSIRTALTCAAVAAALLWAWGQRVEPYLGHDESVYASKARSWMSTVPAAQWNDYRPPGLPALGSLALRLHNSSTALRVIDLLFVIGALAAVYGVAARIGTPRRAVVSLLVVLCGETFLRRMPEFLDDIPSSGVLLVVAYLVASAATEAGQTQHGSAPRRRQLPLAAVLAAAAFYLRYGAGAEVLVIVISAALVWGPTVWRRQWRGLAVAAALLAGCVVPHLIFSVRQTGNPLGLLIRAGQVAHSAYRGDGLVFYAEALPFRLAGDLGGVLMAAGALSAAAAGRRLIRQRRNLTPTPQPDVDHLRAYFGLCAALMIILLGLSAHGEGRFVLLPMMLLIILGVDAVARATKELSSLVLTAVAVLAVLGGAATARTLQDTQFADVTAARRSLVEVMATIKPTPGCLVITDSEPEAGWYSGCASWSPALAARRGLPPARAGMVYVIVFDRASGGLTIAQAKRLFAGRDKHTRTVITTGSLGTATVLS